MCSVVEHVVLSIIVGLVTKRSIVQFYLILAALTIVNLRVVLIVTEVILRLSNRLLRARLLLLLLLLFQRGKSSWGIQTLGNAKLHQMVPCWI